MTQTELTEKVGTAKSYISEIGSGLVEPGVESFLRPVNFFGLRIDISKPVG